MFHKLTIIFKAIFLGANEIEHSITQLKTMLLDVESVNQTSVIASLCKTIITRHQQRHCFACIKEKYRSYRVTTINS